MFHIYHVFKAHLENSILWIDDLEAESYDYIVKKVARSLNSVSYAVSKVSVSE
jgi:hypothetical protein